MEIQSMCSRQYTVEESRIATEALSPEVVVILDQVREALGWPSMKSLAVKYFPAFPRHDWWQAALRRTQQFSRRPNIVYLLKTLESIGRELEGKAYSGRQSLNRISSRLENISQERRRSSSRLESTRADTTSRSAADLTGPLAARVLAHMGAAC